MSTATLEVGANGSDLYFSASSIQRFTDCEMRWLLRHNQPPEAREREAKTEALDLGTLMHRLVGAWDQGRSWEHEHLAALHDDPWWEPGFDPPRAFDRALKIMAAWVEVHGPRPERLLDTVELPFDLPIPGVKGARIRGFLDGLRSVPIDGNRTHDLRRIVEYKTMGRWGREGRVAWDPQLGIYLWAASQLVDVDGVEFEAISTYDYKQGGPERRFKHIVLAKSVPEYRRTPAADGVPERIEIPLDWRTVERTVEDMKRVARRARQVLGNPGLAVRSVGEGCTYCEHHTECLTPWETR